MKKTRLLLLFPILLFSLCGCYDYIDIEEKAMVAGFAVDAAENGYKITAEILSSPASGPEAEILPKIVSAEGETVAACLRKLTAESSKKSDFGHCKIIFISKAVAEQGIEPILDVVFHNDEIKVSIDLAIVKEGEAAAIYESEPLLSSVVSYEAQKTLETAESYLSSSPRGMGYQALNSISSIGTEAVLPIFSITETSGKKTFFLNGCAYFRSDRLQGTLSDKEGLYLKIILGDFRKGVFSVDLPEQEETTGFRRLSPEVLSYSGSMKPSKADPYSIEIHGKMKLRIEEIPPGTSLETEQDRQRLEDRIALALKTDLETFIQTYLNGKQPDFSDSAEQYSAKNRN